MFSRMLIMSKLTEHYRHLLGLYASWEVSEVSLSLEENRVEITLVHRGGPVVCPECDTKCSIADHGPERTWRHLDTMQFETALRARTPRSKCKTCGVKTTTVPWAGKHSRFTLMFEAFAIEVLQACGNVKSAAGLLDLDWDSVHSMMERAVERGLQCRDLDSLQYVGIDEKSFRRGHSYVSILTDLTGHRVLEVVEDRTEEATDKLWKASRTNRKSKLKRSPSTCGLPLPTRSKPTFRKQKLCMIVFTSANISMKESTKCVAKRTKNW